LEPLAGPAHHRHAALPAERRAPPLRRLAQQQLRDPRPRRGSRRRPSSRRLQRVPQRVAGGARVLRELAVRRGRRHRSALGADGDLHAHVPALRRSGRLRRMGRLRGVRAVPLRDGLDRGTHTAVVERASAPRVSDGRGPDLRRPAGPRRRTVARGADLRARRAVRTRAGRRRAVAVAAAPPDRGELVAGDPLRPLGHPDRLRGRRGDSGACAARAVARVGRAGRRGDRCRCVPVDSGAELRGAAVRAAVGAGVTPRRLRRAGSATPRAGCKSERVEALWESK
jgi:hypothetical protein